MKLMGWRDEVGSIEKNYGQKQAFESRGNCVILAGPGSGKTKTITLKVARLLDEEISLPQRVAFVTYSNGCVNELRDRLKKLGVGDDERAFVTTVHGFCLSELIVPFANLAGLSLPDPLVIVSETQRQQIFSDAVLAVRGRRYAEFGLEARCSSLRMSTPDRSADEWLSNSSEERRIVDALEAGLRAAGGIDFDGMILAGLGLVETHPWVGEVIKAKYPILVVDEYQDLGVPLHRMVVTLMEVVGVRVIAVGDPDQSIYGFTGAHPELLRDLSEMKGVQKVNLKTNYRCAPAIASASRSVLGDSPSALAANSEGNIGFHPVPPDLDAQASFAVGRLVSSLLSANPGWKLGDIAFLYRSVNEGAAIANAADALNIPYFRADRGSLIKRSRLTDWMIEVARWCISDLCRADVTISGLSKALLRIAGISPFDPAGHDLQLKLVDFLFKARKPSMRLDIWLKGMVKLFLRDVFASNPALIDEKNGVDSMIAQSKEGEPLGYFTVETLAMQGRDPNRLFLTTLHSAKGLEFNAVVIPGMDDRTFPHYNASPGDIAEARRLFYVGLTRAKSDVHLLYSRTASVFIRELRKSISSAAI